MRSMLVALWISCLAFAGCAPAVVGAKRVGGAETATWVYVATDDKSASGVYRCHDEGGQVTCRQAQMQR